MTEEEQLEEQQSIREAEERMAKITEEHFAAKNGEVEGVEEETPETREEAPKGEGAADTSPEGETAATGDPGANAEAPAGEAEKTEEGEAAEAQTEQPPTPSPEEIADPYAKELEEFEADLQKGPKAKKGAHPNTEKAIEHYRKRARAAKAAEIEAKRRADAIEKEKASLKPLDEATAKELDELRIFRRNTDIEHDPELNTTYTQQVDGLRDQAMQVLEGAGILPESTKKFISENGGVIRFRNSSTLMPHGLKDAQGNAIAVHEDGRPFSQAEFYAEYIEKNLPPAARRTIDRLDNKTFDLEQERQSKINEAKAKGDALFKERAAAQEKQKEQWQADLRTALQAEVAKLGDVAKKQQVPANATAVEKALIDAKNARIDRAAGIIQRYVTEFSPQNLAKMATINAYHETVFPELLKEKDGTIADWRKRAEDAEGKLEAIKKAGRTSDRDSAPPTTEKKATQASQIDDPEARMLAYMQGGR